MQSNFYKKAFVVLIAFLFNTSQFFAQRFDWVNFTPVISGSSGSGGEVLTIDSENNLYTLATFSGTIKAGNDTISQLYPGSSDIYLTKWAPEGNVMWAKVFGGTWIDDVKSVSYNQLKNRIIVGCNIPGAVTGMSDTTYDNTTEYQFITFDTDGNFVSTKFVSAPNLFIDVKGSSIGYFDGWSTVKETDADGNEKWSLSPTYSSGAVRFTNIAITAGTDVLVTGIFGSSFVIGGDTVVADASGIGDNTFLLKIDQSGQVVFANYLGVFGLTYYKSIPLAGDDMGNAYVEDLYYGGGWVFGNDTLPDATGKEGTFIVKYNSEGTADWARYLLSSSLEPHDLYCSNNEIFTCGFFSGTLLFGDQLILPNNNSTGFFAKLDNSGNYIYVNEAGSNSGSSWGAAIISNNNSLIYLTGLTGSSNNATFGCYTQAYASQYLAAIKDTVPIIPEISVTQTNSTLTATTNCSCNIQWYLDGNSIEGASGNEYVVTKNGDYYAIVMDDYNCSAQSNTITISDSFIGELSSAQITIAPNPFVSGIAIHLNEVTKNDIISVNVMNLTGESVFSTKNINMSNGTFTIDLSTLNNGIYFFEAKYGRERIIRKIIKI